MWARPMSPADRPTLAWLFASTWSDGHTRRVGTLHETHTWNDDPWTMRFGFPSACNLLPLSTVPLISVIPYGIWRNWQKQLCFSCIKCSHFLLCLCHVEHEWFLGDFIAVIFKHLKENLKQMLLKCLFMYLFQLFVLLLLLFGIGHVGDSWLRHYGESQNFASTSVTHDWN